MAVLGAGRFLPSVFFSRHLYISASHSARGMNRTLKSLDIQSEEIENLSIEEIESMSNIDKRSLESYAAHIERDAERYQRQVHGKTIERKYFSNRGPEEQNMLTWAMKEQLRYLHSSDPDLWTPEALSLAFPVSAKGAKKLLNVKWIPKNAVAIEKHDQGVLLRWKKHTKGQLGSAQLLEAALKDKFGINSEKLPQLNNHDDILKTLESLRFEHEEQPFAPKNLKPKNKLPKNPKMKQESFASIIKKYEAQQQHIKTVESEKQDVTLPQKCENINEITDGAPKYEGKYSQVLKVKGVSANQKTRSRGKTMMTFSEFMNLKNKS